MNKKILGIIVIIVILAGTFFFFNKSQAPTESVDESGVKTSAGGSVLVGDEITTDESLDAPQQTTAEGASLKTYTLAELATHNKPIHCLSAINGKVYDLTAWVNKHPGGDKAILSICGKDGSAAFNGQHGGQAMQANTLAGFEVGVLAQ